MAGKEHPEGVSLSAPSPDPARGAGSYRLAGATIHPPALEAEFRAAHLREDGRTAAIVVGAFLLLSLPFVSNDAHWAAPAGRLAETLAARALYLLSGVGVIVLGLRARRPIGLDLIVLCNAVLGAALTFILQATRPADYYLPVMQNAVGVLMVFAVIPNRFAFQALAAAAVTGSALGWIAAFRVPPSPPAALLIGVTLVMANLAGAFVSWKLHRSRRLQFLAAREEAEAARRLRESEALFRTAFENASIGKALTEMTGKFLRVNEAFCRMLGYTADELVGKSFGEVTHPDDLETSQQLIRSLVDGAPRAQAAKRYLRKDGEIVWAEIAASLLRDGDGRPRHFITGILDVTGKRRTEEALSATRSRFAELYESLGDGIVSVSSDGTLLEFNEAYRRMLGYTAEELRGMSYIDVTPGRWHAEERRILDENVRRRAPFTSYEKEYRRKDGTVFPVEIRAFFQYPEGLPVRMWGIVRDITESRALRDQLAVASRLASMGTLVAGVAHEINNPLGGAIASHGFASEELARVRTALRSGEPLDRTATAIRLDDVVDALDDAAAGEQRVASIVKDLTLLGRPEVRRSRVLLSRAVEESMRWIPASLLQRAEIRVEDGGTPELAASEGQIAQVVANLVTNAIRATPDGRKARVRIGLGAGAPGFARIEVADDGAGMTPEVMSHMFDPFFTTRDVGHGMGLGLAICHAIVSAHGGTIAASSKPGKGSTFRVELPAAQPAA
jgi:PAS domain S-box-containing protein